MRNWWVVLALAGCIGDSDPPELMELTPLDGTEYRGVNMFNVFVEYRDASEVRPRFFIDSQHVATETPDCDDESCTVQLRLSTIEFAAGAHDFTVALEDDAGNVTTETRSLWFDDVLEIQKMRVTGIQDESGLLEIEVYAFDEANTLIGCAGSRHGLGFVDLSDTDYQPSAVMISDTSLALATADIGSRRFRLEVWEDDDSPVCPTYPDAAGNDFLGRSPALSVEEWRTAGSLSFDQVTNLEVAWTRSLSESSDPDPDPDPDDPWFGGSSGGGCNAGAQLHLAWLLAFAALRRKHTREARG